MTRNMKAAVRAARAARSREFVDAEYARLVERSARATRCLDQIIAAVLQAAMLEENDAKAKSGGTC